MPDYPWDLAILISLQLAIAGFLSWKHELLQQEEYDERTVGDIVAERILWTLWLTVLNCTMYLCIMVITPSWFPGRIDSPKITENSRFLAGIIFTLLVIFISRRHLGSEFRITNEIGWIFMLYLLHQAGYASFIETIEILSSRS